MKEQIVTELTPELADKIWKQMEKKRYDEEVSKKAVLHHLKQLKAQMSKLKTGYEDEENDKWDVGYTYGVVRCMEAIDKKIAKINGKK